MNSTLLMKDDSTNNIRVIFLMATAGWLRPRRERKSGTGADRENSVGLVNILQTDLHFAISTDLPPER